MSSKVVNRWWDFGFIILQSFYFLRFGTKWSGFCRRVFMLSVQVHLGWIAIKFLRFFFLAHLAFWSKGAKPSEEIKQQVNKAVGLTEGAKGTPRRSVWVNQSDRHSYCIADAQTMEPDWFSLDLPHSKHVSFFSLQMSKKPCKSEPSPNGSTLTWRRSGMRLIAAGHFTLLERTHLLKWSGITVLLLFHVIGKKADRKNRLPQNERRCDGRSNGWSHCSDNRFGRRLRSHSDYFC